MQSEQRGRCLRGHLGNQSLWRKQFQNHSHIPTPCFFLPLTFMSVLSQRIINQEIIIVVGFFFFFLVTCILKIRRHLLHKYCVILFKEFKIFLINTFLQRDISKPKYRKKRIIMVYKTGPQSNFFIFLF